MSWPFNRHHASVLLLLVTTAFAAVALSACETTSHKEVTEKAERQLTDRILATVNGRPIRVLDLQGSLEELPPYVRQSVKGETALRTFRTGMIEFELLYGQAEQLGLGVDPDVLVAARKGLAYELWKETDRQVLATEISEDSMRAFYERHPERYEQAPQVTVKSLKTFDYPKSERLRTTIFLMQGALNGGPSGDEREMAFDEVKRSKESPVERETLGPMGLGDAGVLAPRQLIEAALALNDTHEVSAPVLTSEGFHLLRLVQKQGTPLQSFEDVRERVHLDVLEEARQRNRRELVQKLRSSASIEILDASLRP